MRSVLILFLFSSLLPAAQNNLNVVTQIKDTIHSAILQEDRYIDVQIPGKAIADPTRRYPVIYILDGQALSHDVNNALKKLSKETGKNVAGEIIVVSLGNIWQRYRDYSPTHITFSPGVDEHTISTTGGGEKFISFLEKELIPHINSTTPASATRILIGHSMGGLIAMKIWLDHENLFSHYAMVDPCMWWDDDKLLKESIPKLSEKSFEKTSLFIAVANTTDKDMDVAQINNDTSSRTALIRPSLTLIDHINAGKQNKLKFTWKFYKEFHHMTVFPAAAYDALKFFVEGL